MAVLGTEILLFILLLFQSKRRKVLLLVLIKKEPCFPVHPCSLAGVFFLLSVGFCFSRPQRLTSQVVTLPHVPLDLTFQELKFFTLHSSTSAYFACSDFLLGTNGWPLCSCQLNWRGNRTSLFLPICKWHKPHVLTVGWANNSYAGLPNNEYFSIPQDQLQYGHIGIACYLPAKSNGIATHPLALTAAYSSQAHCFESSYRTCGRHLSALACIMPMFRKEEFNLHYSVADLYCSMWYTQLLLISHFVFLCIKKCSSTSYQVQIGEDCSNVT